MRRLTIEQLINLSLKDVSGRPDRCHVRLARPAEIDALAGHVGEGTDRGIVTYWRMIALEATGEPVIVILIGYRGHENLGTSPIVAFDEAGAKVRTHSGSIYRLGRAGEGDPPVDHVVHVCFLLNAWGLGEALDLPEVWY